MNTDLDIYILIAVGVFTVVLGIIHDIVSWRRRRAHWKRRCAEATVRRPYYPRAQRPLQYPFHAK